MPRSARSGRRDRNGPASFQHIPEVPVLEMSGGLAIRRLPRRDSARWTRIGPTVTSRTGYGSNCSCTAPTAAHASAATCVIISSRADCRACYGVVLRPRSAPCTTSRIWLWRAALAVDDVNRESSSFWGASPGDRTTRGASGGDYRCHWSQARCGGRSFRARPRSAG
jgi:hypothetical protein